MGANALARFERDVLGQLHADVVTMMMGINDIGWPGSVREPTDRVPTADEVIARDDVPEGRRCLERRACNWLLPERET